MRKAKTKPAPPKVVDIPVNAPAPLPNEMTSVDAMAAQLESLTLVKGADEDGRQGNTESGQVEVVGGETKKLPKVILRLKDPPASA